MLAYSLTHLCSQDPKIALACGTSLFLCKQKQGAGTVVEIEVSIYEFRKEEWTSSYCVILRSWKSKSRFLNYVAAGSKVDSGS